MPLVYEELRNLAANKLASETSGQTLQPTALVHEVWIRLQNDSRVQVENRGHFYVSAAEAMRRILIQLRFLTGLTNHQACVWDAAMAKPAGQSFHVVSPDQCASLPVRFF